MGIKSKQFSCECYYPFHILQVDYDEDFGLAITVVNKPDNFIQKLKAIWFILRGDEHICSEVYVRGVDMFIEYVKGLKV